MGEGGEVFSSHVFQILNLKKGKKKKKNPPFIYPFFLLHILI